MTLKFTPNEGPRPIYMPDDLEFDDRVRPGDVVYGVWISQEPQVARSNRYHETPKVRVETEIMADDLQKDRAVGETTFSKYIGGCEVELMIIRDERGRKRIRGVSLKSEMERYWLGTIETPGKYIIS